MRHWQPLSSSSSITNRINKFDEERQSLKGSTLGNGSAPFADLNLTVHSETCMHPTVVHFGPDAEGRVARPPRPKSTECWRTSRSHTYRKIYKSRSEQKGRVTLRTTGNGGTKSGRIDRSKRKPFEEFGPSNRYEDCRATGSKSKRRPGVERNEK
jgi:hypothetical protein